MICKCGHKCTVVDVRKLWAGETDKMIRRRYECQDCHRRFSAVEAEEETFDEYKKRAINAETELYAMTQELKKLLGKD